LVALSNPTAANQQQTHTHTHIVVIPIIIIIPFVKCSGVEGGIRAPVLAAMQKQFTLPVHTHTPWKRSQEEVCEMLLAGQVVL
jgi:hypothetical protein